jgi:hypothetical protein
MEGLAPTLQICMELRMSLERGESLHAGLRSPLMRPSGSWRGDIQRMLRHFEQYGNLRDFTVSSSSPYRRELISLVGLGLSGAPVVAKLRELEVEIRWACQDELDLFIARLPLRALLPVLLIQFPAFLILLFGPILSEFTRSLSQ